jgi:serine/threonine-protein kinase RsbW
MQSLWVRNAPASASAVRQRLYYDLDEAGVDRETADDAALLASELVANAVRHARAMPNGHLQVGWQIDADEVFLQVTDGGSASKRPRVKSVRIEDTSGRGLSIVAALAAEWGVIENQDGTTVWARLGIQHATPV